MSICNVRFDEENHNASFHGNGIANAVAMQDKPRLRTYKTLVSSCYVKQQRFFLVNQDRESGKGTIAKPKRRQQEYPAFKAARKHAAMRTEKTIRKLAFSGSPYLL